MSRAIPPDSKPAAIAGPADLSPPAPVPALKATAQLCTALGRVSDSQELRTLIGRAADTLQASGLVLWMGTPAGDELRPAVAHGYTPQVVARIPPVPRSANNAAAAAYRTATLQIVLSRPGSAKGAVVAPVVSAEGCIGVLSAEVRDGCEASETVQALAEIIAAQLAGVLASTPAGSEGRSTGSAAM
jgi:GAF domain-containing protein